MALPKPPRWTKDPPPRLAESPAIEALAAQLAGGADPEEAAAAFWTTVAGRGTPLVDPVDEAQDERVVTFLWRDRHGSGPGTCRVVLIANKLTDPSLPDESALQRVRGTDVWWRAFRLSSAWRGTYVLAADDEPGAGIDEPGAGIDEPGAGIAGWGDGVGASAATGDGVDDATGRQGIAPAAGGDPTGAGTTAGRARGRWGALTGRAARDPRNPHTFPGPAGASTLSLLELPDAPPQPWNVRPGTAPRGTVDEVRTPGIGDGEERRAWVYVPAVPRSEPHRLLLLLDGADWLGRRDAPAILDALHHAGRIPPTIALLVDSGVGPQRTADLATGDPFLERLVEVLPRWMRERYPVGERREHLVLAGESMGGVAVLRAAGRSPELVGAVVAQSASLWWDGQEAADAPSPTVELLRDRPPVGVRVHLHVGRDEWILLTAHRALRGALTDGGVDHALVEFEGGHDAVCWRGGLAEGLISVLGDRAS